MKPTFKHTVLAVVVFISGISLSVVAAFYSIIGLSTMFSGSKESVIVMGVVLEISKLAAISWLYHNWDNSPFMIKSYLVMSVIVLMGITSMGIFGYLSKAHIDQQVAMSTGSADGIKSLYNDIKLKESKVEDLTKQIEQIDGSVSRLSEVGQVKTSVKELKNQQPKRDKLVADRNAESALITDSKNKLIRLESEQKKIEAEIGPIKYVAELIYGESSEEIIDKSIRMVIMVIMFVFDPMAVFLLLAFNVSIVRRGDEYAEMEYLDIKNKNVMRRQQRAKKQTTA